MKTEFVKLIRCFVVALGVLTIILHAQRTVAQTQLTNEFWICNTTNTANLGTLSDPYDGSTQTKFDSIMANLPTGCTVHLLGGTYRTHGDALGNGGYLLRGQKVLGSGIDVTILQLAS